MNVGIVGAGLVGRLLALSLAKKQCQVSLFDQDTVVGANSCAYTGAGMLAPYSELEFAEPLIFVLGVDSVRLWTEILSKLDQRVFLQAGGTIAVAHPRDVGLLDQFFDRIMRRLQTYSLSSVNSMPDPSAREDACAPREHPTVKILGPTPGSAGFSRQHEDAYRTPLAAYPRAPNLPKYLDAQEFSELEPTIASRFNKAISLPDEGQIDNRQLLQALSSTIESFDIEWQSNTSVKSIEPGEITTQSGEHHCDLVIDCRGLGAKTDLPLRGVRGEIIDVYAPEVNITRPIRFMHPRYPLYVVPRENNRFLIGATSIESDDMSPITVQSALELLSAAFSLDSSFAEASIVETRANCRPALPHNLPSIIHKPGLIRVNGLYRHGFLMAPKLAEIILEFIEHGTYEASFEQLFKRRPRVMQILVNGMTREIREPITVKQLLTELGYELNAIAVAIDGSHLPRSSWEASTIKQQNDIEIIAPMQGG